MRQIIVLFVAFAVLTGTVGATYHQGSGSQSSANQSATDQDSTNKGIQKSAGKKPKVILLANFIDFELATDFFGFLGNKGMNVTHVNASDFEEYKTEKFIVILGGPDAYDGVGEIVQDILSEGEENAIRQKGNRKKYVKINPWGLKPGQKVTIIAGSNRNQTKKAHEENRENLSQSIISESEEEEEAVEVKIKGFSFTPPTKTISIGTTVKWTNEDSASHTVTSVDTAFDSGTLGKDNSWSYTFDTAGTFEYRCEIHPSMQHGKIIVQ